MNAFVRAAASEHLRLKRGVNSLAAIATAAPLLGFLDTIIGIRGSFRGGSGPKEYHLGRLAFYLSESILFTAAGLAIGLVALFFHRLLTAQHARLAIPAAAAPPPRARR